MKIKKFLNSEITKEDLFPIHGGSLNRCYSGASKTYSQGADIDMDGNDSDQG